MRPAVLTRSTDHWRALRPRRTPEIAVRSGLGRARGALVGAAKADVITSLNGEPVRDFPARAPHRRHAAGHRRGSQRTAPWRSENRGAAIRQIA
jgi:hypothetical protein